WACRTRRRSMRRAPCGGWHWEPQLYRSQERGARGEKLAPRPWPLLTFHCSLHPGISMAVIWINGAWYDRDSAKVSVFDHGLLYGDGVFEGIRAYQGRVFRLEQHLERLYDSARAIALTIPLAAGGL